MFTDPEFTATQGSLGGDFRVARWARLSDLYDHPIIGNFDPKDVIQGAVGDCYLLSAMCNLAADERRIDELFDERRDGGRYTIRFYEQGRRVNVVIDDYIPLDVHGIPVFARGLTGLWVALVEKAYAKLHGSYSAIDGGYESVAMHELTGGVPLMYPLRSEALAVLGGGALDSMWKRLRVLLREGALIGVSHDGATNQGIFGHHSYAVIDTRTVRARGSSTRLVLVRNPHGSTAGDWTGRWSSEDPMWSSEPPLGARGFYMSLADFIRVFATLSICRLPGPEWTTHQVRLSPGDDATLTNDVDTQICLSVSQRLDGSISISSLRNTTDYPFDRRVFGIELNVHAYDFPLTMTCTKECYLRIWTSTTTEMSRRVTVRF